jgi:hypothetical protein
LGRSLEYRTKSRAGNTKELRESVWVGHPERGRPSRAGTSRSASRERSWSMDNARTWTPSGGATVHLDWSDGGPAPNGDADLEKVERAGHDLIVEGHGVIHKQDNGPLVAPEAVVAAADVESLGRATRDQRRCCAELPESIYVGRVAPTVFDPELFEPEPVTIQIDADGVYARVEMLLTRVDGDAARYRAWLGPAALPHGCEVSAVRLTVEGGSEVEEIAASWPDEWQDHKQAYLASQQARPRWAEVRVAPSAPMTVGTLLAAGRDVHALLSGLRGGPIDVVSAAHLLRARLPHLLVGLPESEWLEVKSEPYALQAPEKASKRAKIELAQDVARFANGDVPALLVIGLRTAKEDGGEVVRKVTPAKRSVLSVDQYRKVIDAHVHPAIDGLTVETVDIGNGRALLMIGVPAQPSDYKPFLVHGAIVGERIEGAFISIVRRRGDGSVPTTASQIHAALVAGRALLQEMRADRLRHQEEVIRRKSKDHASQVRAGLARADDDNPEKMQG